MNAASERTTHPGDLPKPGVLCVDDDAAVLDLLDRHLRTDYAMSKATNGEEALAVLAHTADIAVVVADMNMPGMNGVALLAKVRSEAPTIARVMLTGESGQAIAAQAINSGQIFRFLVPSPMRSNTIT
jgi:CheY-like chemotaxis protein